MEGAIKETKNYTTNEDFELFLCHLKLRDDLLRVLIGKGIDTLDKLADIDKYNLNNYINEGNKKLIKQNLKKLFEAKEESPEEDMCSVIKNMYFDLGGIAITKEMIMNGFKMKGKNAFLPTHLKENNINPSQIFSSFLSQKGLSSLINYDGFKNLKYLYLSDNKIQSIVAMNFPNLLQLDLTNNYIRRIENLDGLLNLTTLSLDKNLIKVLEGISSLRYLDTLTLSKQGLTSNQVFEINPQDYPVDNSLTTLSLDHNNLFDPTPLAVMRRLTKLKLNDNKIYDIGPLLDALNDMCLLEELSIASNPFIDTNRNFRDLVILRCGSLKEIDNKTVTSNELQYVNKLYSKKMTSNKMLKKVSQDMGDMRLDIAKVEGSQLKNNFNK
jgi:hypothetical protein